MSKTESTAKIGMCVLVAVIAALIVAIPVRGRDQDQLKGSCGKELQVEIDAGRAERLRVDQGDDDDRGDRDNGGKRFTDSFMLESCTFSSLGKNPYFVLQPGYRLTFRGTEKGQPVSLVITVLNETKLLSGVETRVVEERETKDDKLVEVSRNYFAICQRTNSVFYFGEDVDMFEKGKAVSHRGSWRAGVNDARAGLMMPGSVLLGSRYQQEVAPGVALDRAEIVSMTEVVQTPAGRFESVLKVKETTPLEPGVEEFKFYAPGIGLIKDGRLELVSVTR